MIDLFIRSIRIDHGLLPPDCYSEEIPALKNLTTLSFHRPVTFFTGENGSGKSTLIEAMAIAYGFNPEGGTRNYHMSTQDTHSPLYQAISFIRSAKRPKWGYYMRGESFYNIASFNNAYADGKQPDYHIRSHGQGMLEAMQDNMSPQSIYFFDEPESALSPSRQLTLLKEISDYASMGCQFIIATHSIILLSLPEAEILSFDNEEIEPIGYEQTPAYRLTSLFINHRDRILRQVLTDE